MGTVGKKAWIRIFEAFLAIAIFASFLLVLFIGGETAPSKSKQITQLEKIILNEIGNDVGMRENVIDGSEESLGEIRDFIRNRLPVFFNFTIKVCDIGEVCGMDFYQPEVYSEESVISSTLENYQPKKLKLFVWVED